ncbi:N-acetyltransferase [Rhizobium leucaenae]|uniref:N-acetyltransferase n=1 Tax=Rhizobium leucaenae TaxID=29450 RepID=UPI001806C3BF|nr:hypothetical protein [Rhizobium leucaenae]
MRFTWRYTVGGETEMLARLVADRIWPGKGKDFGKCQAIAIFHDETELAAGLIYHNWDPDAAIIEISGASWIKGWLTKSVLRAMYGYPFVDCGCQAVVQRVSDDDTAQHRMLKVYGAEHYRIPRLRGQDKAENIFVTTREAWQSNKFSR